MKKIIYLRIAPGAGIFVLSAALTLGALSIPRLSQSQPAWVQLSPIALQIHEDLEIALQKNRHAEDYDHWQRSDYTPKNILENIRALNVRGANEALCQALSQIAPSELALFAEEISSSPTTENKLTPNCASSIHTRLENYWRTIRELFSEKHPLSPGSFSSLERDFTEQTREISVDLAQAPRFFQPELKEGEIALFFDLSDSRNEEYFAIESERTQRILRALRDQGVEATFFATGRLAHESPLLIREIIRAGHAVGTRMETSHPLHRAANLDLDHLQSEIFQNHRSVTLAAGQFTPWIRFPENATSSLVEPFLRKNQLISLPWSIDSQDYRLRDPETLLQHTLQELALKKRGTLLLRASYEQTTLMLPALLQELKARNFKTVIFKGN